MDSKRPAGMLRSKCLVVVLMLGSLGLTACDLPKGLQANLASSASLTAVNGFVSALMNSITAELFGTTGTVGAGDTEPAGEDDHDDDGDDHAH